MADTIYRQAAIDALDEYFVRIGELKRRGLNKGEKAISLDTVGVIKTLPSAQPERTWYPATEPPNHHNDVIVRGIEAIGNVTVHKIMQWDVDTWRPTDYAPSITWKEWSEI